MKDIWIVSINKREIQGQQNNILFCYVFFFFLFISFYYFIIQFFHLYFILLFHLFISLFNSVLLTGISIPNLVGIAIRGDTVTIRENSETLVPISVHVFYITLKVRIE